MVHDIGILIHAGAGNQLFADRNSNRIEEIRKTLELSASLGYDFLDKKNDDMNPNCVLDAVETAVAMMEDSGLFDAGLRDHILQLRAKLKWMLP